MSGLSYDFFVPVEDSAVHPCDPAVQIRKSLTAPPKGGGVYKKRILTENMTYILSSENRSSALHGPSRKAKSPLCWGRKHSNTLHTLRFFSSDIWYTQSAHTLIPRQCALSDNVCPLSVYREQSFTEGDGQQSQLQPHFTQIWNFWGKWCCKGFLL